MNLLEASNLILTAMMTGVIWLVQLVHYPMFTGLDRKAFLEWHEFHSRRISLIVIPLMVAELAVSLLLVLQEPNLRSFAVLALTIAVWLSTFLLSVPLHNDLAVQGYSAETLTRLVTTNWPRTVLYTIKLSILTFALST